MKKIITNLFLLLAGFLGCLLIFYPHLAFWLTGQEQEEIVQGYLAEVQQADPAEVKAQWERARYYNETLAGKRMEDPFETGSGAVSEAAYLQQLNLNEAMAGIRIPKIGVNLPVYHGTSADVLYRGAGHLEGSSLPVGGPGTHTVITAHTGLDTAKMFSSLTELETGDLFFIYVLDEILAYEVDQITVVEPTGFEQLFPVAGEDYATLLTCTPYGINSHRLLVRGRRTAFTAEEAGQIVQNSPFTAGYEGMLLIVAGLAVGVMIIIMAVMRRRRNRYGR